MRDFHLRLTVSVAHLVSVILEPRSLLAQSQTDMVCSEPSSTATNKLPPSCSRKFFFTPAQCSHTTRWIIRIAALTALENEMQQTDRSKSPTPITWRVWRLTEFHIRMWGWNRQQRSGVSNGLLSNAVSFTDQTNEWTTYSSSTLCHTNHKTNLNQTKLKLMNVQLQLFLWSKSKA